MVVDVYHVARNLHNNVFAHGTVTNYQRALLVVEHCN